MSRLYFTDPIIAAYMAKEFGVEFFILGEDEKGKEGKYDFQYISLPKMFSDLFKMGIDDLGKIYIAKESESIFEPEDGDMDQYGRFFTEVKTTTKIINLIDLSKPDTTKIKYDMRWSSIFEKTDEDGKNISESLKANPKIVMRDGKQFFDAIKED